MDIRFCDLCNESVPDTDLRSGRATQLNGRVICAQCERAMGGESPAPSARPDAAAVAASQRAAPGPPRTAALGLAGESDQPVAAAPAFAGATPAPRRSGALGTVLALGALSAVGFGGNALVNRIDGLEGRLARGEADSAGTVASLRSERSAAIAPLNDRVDRARDEAIEAARGISEASEASLSSLRSQLDAARQREDTLRTDLESARRKIEELRAESARSGEKISQSMANMERLVGFHGDRIIELEERIREAGALVAAGGFPSAPGEANPGAAAEATWKTLLPDLVSTDQAVRLDAVISLGATEDAAVIEHVIPMLKDSDVFVRMVAAQALDDLRAKTAVPALIDTLGDDRSSVREAAIIALRNITNQSFGFSPTAREADRSRKVDQWRGWWRRSGDDFLAS